MTFNDSEALKIVLASATVTVFVTTAIIFFTVGFLCRHFCQKEKNQGKTTVSPLNSQDMEQSHCVHELELKSNVAYENITMN